MSQDQQEPHVMTADQVQEELRRVTGTWCKTEADSVRRQQLWQRLDRLMKAG